MGSALSSTTLNLHWPTDYPVITQGFGENAEIHAQSNLPGYDGVDIRAPFNSPVYACTDGEVITVVERSDNARFGRNICIAHEGGYQTVYGYLAKIMVKRGQKVRAGHEIATAGGPVDSQGNRIKFVLKQIGATASGLTHYPDDIVDPTPFLAISKQSVKSSVFPWAIGRCLAGVKVKPDGMLSDIDHRGVKENRLDAVKLNLLTPAEYITRLRQGNPTLFLMTGLHLPTSSKVLSPEDWSANIRARLKEHVGAGVTFFEVHRAPNLLSEGAFTTWENGKGFARWWLDVLAILHQTFPDVKFGFPALSIGGLVPGQRLDSAMFQSEADEAMLSADWIGVNCYWNNVAEMVDEKKGAGYKTLRRFFPKHLLFITEFANVNALVHETAKEKEYAMFYSTVKDEPGIGAAFAQMASDS